AGHLFGIAGGQPRESGDVARLPPNGVDTTGDHVVNGSGVDVGPVEQSAPPQGTQVDGMYSGQCAIALADRGTHCVDDVRLGHLSDSFFGDSAKDDGEVLLTDLLCGERSAGLIPAHRHPGGVTDETVDKVDVEVGPQVALVDALVEHLHPHLALLTV